MKKIKYILFFAMILAQWYIPLKMLSEQKTVINNGEEFHFETTPVDPYDPFRGKYIDLNFTHDNFKADYISSNYKGVAFAEIGKDSKGFAKIISLSKDAYEHENFLKITVTSVQENTAYFSFPFDKYFLNEHIAETSEKSYNSISRNNGLRCYAKVKIKSGSYALQDVMIENQSIAEISKKILTGVFIEQEGILSQSNNKYSFLNCDEKTEITLEDQNQQFDQLLKNIPSTEIDKRLYINALIDQSNSKLVYIFTSEKLSDKTDCTLQ